MVVPRAPRLTADEWRTVSALFLEAVECTAGARERFLAGLTGDRAWLRAEVESLLLAHENAGDFIDHHRTQDLIGTRIGPWRLVAEIARGGMGVVYRAERDDDQFEKQAAIKVVNPDLRTPELLLRFRTERRVLARLEHPNIARLLDSGVSEDGLPYIVLELVDGVPLRHYLSAGPVSLDERLRLFRLVCAAVHVAHQHLVVHRDLKPANVLVTAAGDVKLVDFGIAKLLSETVRAETTAAIRRFTPEYASPEQLRDEPISTASDVYSLGVLLYELIAARPPFEVDGVAVDEAVRRICGTDPPPPSSVDPDRRASRELDAIVAQAMRKNPRERYGSVRELSDDVERYFAGRAVVAHAPSMSYIARKFVARHRLGVAAAALLVCTIVAGVGGIAWQARIAERQRATSERRFEDLRKLSGSVLFELHDAIATLPGATAPRRLLVDRSKQYLEMLSQEAPGNVALQLELANAYIRVGNVQGGPSLANLGDTAGALASYDRAERLSEAVLADHPGHVRALRTLGRVHVAASDVHVYLRELPEAAERARKNLEIQEGLARTGPDDELNHQNLANGYFVLARTGAETRPFDETLRLWRRSGDIYEELRRKRPENRNMARNVALVRKHLGYLFSHNGDHKQGAAEFEAARAIDQALVDRDPGDAQSRLDLTFDLTELARIEELLGNPTNAADYQMQALTIRRTLVDQDPRDVRARLRLVFSLIRVGWAQLRQRSPAAATKMFREADDQITVVLNANPGDPRSMAYRGEVWLGLGSIDERSGNRAAACQRFSEAAGLFRTLEQQSPLDADAKDRYATAARKAAACSTSRPAAPPPNSN